MQENEQHYGRKLGMGRSANSAHNNLPPVSGFGRHVADDYHYPGSQEHAASRVELISQHKHSSRRRDFNWQFLVFWTAYAALIFGIGYALI